MSRQLDKIMNSSLLLIDIALKGNKQLDAYLRGDRPVLYMSVAEGEKNLHSVQQIWHFLLANGATRYTKLICIGGGILCDMGAFAASTFMRGMHFVLVPTTVLAAADAAIGGKTGINILYEGNLLKNHIGTFAQADEIVLDTLFFESLSNEQVLSGYAEMLKHGLIADEDYYFQLLGADMSREQVLAHIEDNIKHSVAIKHQIVETDPKEGKERKALNFGHTIGHALEEYTYAKQRALLHGYAVAYGMVAELYLSVKLAGLDSHVLSQYAQFVLESYGRITCSCKDYEVLYALMQHDKKNVRREEVTVCLLSAVGMVYTYDYVVTKEDVFEALDYLFSL